ncbi:MAG TPA: DNRLRE domain-containing protein [Vicinamibacterales bacterium]|nr:DNRLRE domain-containing protein [Vicinamibacterales bacterium]
MTLNAPSTQETDATIRGGTYANTNYGGQLVTQAHTDASLVRRALLKFDTETTIPAGTAIASAKLTVTVIGGGSDATRPITAFNVTSTFQSTQATWNLRKTSYAWGTPGGDLTSALSPVSVGNVAGTTVTFDVTKLVQAAVNEPTGLSRYTRIALVDTGSASDNAMRTYASSSSTNAAQRPSLTVVYGASASPTPPSPPPAASTLRVLQYNTHHGGYGTDGVWNVDRLIASALKTNPDVISFNEVERGTSWSKGGDDLQLFLASIQKQSGQTWYGVFVTGAGSSTGIGNAILSRTPFVGHSTYQLSDGRAILQVQIAWNGRIVNLFSTHLDADSTSYRVTEIDELKAWTTSFAENRVVCGDFNSSQGSTEWNDMSQTYVDAWAEAKTAGDAVSYPSNPGGNTRNGRIDFVWTSKGAGQLTLVGSQVFDTRDANGVQPSDHRPVMAIFAVK